MPITKSFLRHEIQNILMVLGCQLEEIKTADKEKILNLIKQASLFIEYDNLFLDKKLEFYTQKIPVSDVFEMMIGANEEIIKRRKINLKVNPSTCELKIDRDYILKALTQIFTKILEQTSNVELSFEEKKNMIVLSHEGGLISFEKKDLENVLKNEKNNYQEIVFQISLHVLEAFGCILKVNEKEVMVFLPDKNNV